jgi:glucose-6-phosphate isomerase
MATDLPDLDRSSSSGQWTRFCDLLWHHEPLGLWLDVSRMALSAAEMQNLQAPLAQAFDAMDALEKGAIANPDEGRQVGHYWLRQPDLAPDRSVADHISAEVRRLQAFGQDVLGGTLAAPTGEPFSDVLWIGIGGSGLGPMLMIRALQENRRGLTFHFLDNVDPAGMSRLFDALGDRLLRTLVVVVSKSGGTPEPHLGMLQARERLQQLGGQWNRQAVAITMRDSQLDRTAAAETWLNRFDMFDWVGGRTSITSAVGLLPAVLAGIDAEAFLQGAAVMDTATRRPDLGCNPAALMAASWYAAGEGRGCRDMVVLPYCDRLEVFSRYLQQLVMESLGKRLDRQGRVVNQGIAVYGNKGSTDQHAYVQQLRDGIDNFFVTFIEVLEDPTDIPCLDGARPGDYLDGFLQGTRAALFEGGRQSMTLTLRHFDARALGALIALFERAVGLYGELIDINAYHQPGVEAGKKAAAQVLELQGQVETLLADGRERGIEEIAADLNRPADCESIFFSVRHHCGNPRGYSSNGNWSDPRALRVRSGG